VELDCAAHTDKTPTKLQRHSRKTKQLHSQETEKTYFLKSCGAQWVSRWFFCINHTAQNIHFAFIQLNDQVPGLYENSHPDHTQRDKVDLTWERISHDIREHGILWLKLHRIVKESWLIKATKIICYELRCWQVIMWVFILHNDRLQLTDVTPLRWSCSCRS